MTNRPEILTHPNIPKPLHGLNPRTILGKQWWDTTRYAAQTKYNNCCAACGVPKYEAKKHRWLEGHEYFDINYHTGVCEVIEIVPLCHYCHNFIHSGRLFKILGTEKTKNEVVEILEHGFNILRQNNLPAFPGTIEIAKYLDINIDNLIIGTIPNSTLAWNDWTLLLNGKEYKSKFSNFEEWKRFYNK